MSESVITVERVGKVPPKQGERGELLCGRALELDGIRGTAILLVLICHYAANQIVTVPGSPEAYAVRLLSLTWAGVDLFFVLSGFLLGGILLDNRNSPNYFKAFYVRRACRILPLYYVMFLTFVAGVFVTARGSGGAWSHWLFGDALPLWSYATSLQNVMMAEGGSFGPNWMGVTWSLAVEEQFYLVLPLMMRLVPATAQPKLLCLLILVTPIVRTLLFAVHHHGAMAAFVLLPSRWDALFLGVLGANAVRDPATLRRLRGSIPVLRSTVVGATCVALVLLAADQSVFSVGMTMGGYTVMAVLSLGVILLATISEGGRTQTLFRHPWLVWLGSVSYGVYLFHQPLSGLMHGLLRQQTPRIAGLTDMGVTLMALACTLLLAVASERLFERPIISIGRRVSYRDSR